MMEELNCRSRQILESLIDEYIGSCEPVGSRTISKKQLTTLSAATVRNVMSDLEELGFLASPHTSAGRIPTDKAYRFYVDRLLKSSDVSYDISRFEEKCRFSSCDLDSALNEASRFLSSLSRYVGIVAAPSVSSRLFQQIEFIKLGRQRILTILVSSNGTVQNRLIESDTDIDSEELIRMSNYLNSLLKGLSFSQVKKKLKEEMESEQARYDSLKGTALKVSHDVIGDEETHLFIDGQINLIDQPEFSDSCRIKEFLKTFEDRNQILTLMDRSSVSRGIQIFIGSETHLSGMEGISLITSTYRTGKDTFGVLGVIGPTRMGYAKVIPIVDYTAKMISSVLDASD